MSNHLKMFEEGYKFVYRTEDLNYNIDDQYEENEEFHWRRFSEEITCEVIFNILFYLIENRWKKFGNGI